MSTKIGKSCGGEHRVRLAWEVAQSPRAPDEAVSFAGNANRT